MVQTGHVTACGLQRASLPGDQTRRERLRIPNAIAPTARRISRRPAAIGGGRPSNAPVLVVDAGGALDSPEAAGATATCVGGADVDVGGSVTAGVGEGVGTGVALGSGCPVVGSTSV